MSIIGVRAVVEFGSLGVACLGRTYLGGTGSLVPVGVVLASSGSVCSSIVAMAEAGGTHLLVIIDSILLEDIVECDDSISITCVEPISSKLLQLSIRHLLSFLQLLRIELNLSWVDG